MNSRKFMKGLRNIGLEIRSNIPQEEIEVALEHESFQYFFKGIFRNSIVINNMELKSEKEMCHMKKNILAFGENNLNFVEHEEFDMSTEILRSELDCYEEYIAALEKSNNDLQTKLKYQVESPSDTCEVQTFSDRSRKETEIYRKHLSKLEENLKSLEECCLKVQKSTCGKYKEPAFLYQMPINFFTSIRNKFELYIKDFILKQFKEEVFLLSEQNDPIECLQANPRDLNHLVSGPLKQQYQQQCKEFDRLQIGYYSVLKDINRNEAKLKGIQSAMEAIKRCDRNIAEEEEEEVEHLMKMSSDLTLLESQLNNIALDYSLRKVELVMIGNFRIKQRRQQFYIEQLNMLEKLLKQQFDIDKLIWITSKVEKLLADEACMYLQTIGAHIQAEIQIYTNALRNLKELVLFSNQKNMTKIADLTLVPSKPSIQNLETCVSMYFTEKDDKLYQANQQHEIETNLEALISRLNTYDIARNDLKKSKLIFESQANIINDLEQEYELQQKQTNLCLESLKMKSFSMLPHMLGIH